MYRPYEPCVQQPAPSVRGCCTPGFRCTKDPSASATGQRSCQPVPKGQLSYSYDAKAKGGCSLYVGAGGQCGGAGFACYQLDACNQWGPWLGACCPNGYSCQPAGQDFRLWTCQVNLQDQPPVDTAQELLQ